jgi:hypothetical protein
MNLKGDVFMGLFDILMGKDENTKKLENKIIAANPRMSKSSIQSATLKELINILQENESIQYAAIGMNGIHISPIILTNKRIIYLKIKGLMSKEIHDINYSKISSLNIKRGTILDDVVLSVLGTNIEIDGLNKEESVNVYNKIKQQMELNDSDVAATTVPDNDILGKLERLAKLREQGVLSEDEFTEQKKRILS